MNTAWRVTSALAVALMLAGGTAWAQEKKPAAKPDCPQPSASPGTAGQPRAQAPQKIDGQVTAIDMSSGMVTVKGDDGKSHQFRGSQETLRDYKVGDQVQLTLRSEPC